MAYANTDHLFSQPIRTYKANDPYYYEVDNIPIRQLEENVLWVKDQIDSLIAPNQGAEPQTGSPLFVGDDIDLEHIKQFRPKFVGGRSISVQAGRYNARINDAYQVTDSLAQIAATFLGGCSDLPRITSSDSVAFFDAVWAAYTTKLTSESFVSCPGESNEAAAYRANGLETMFTFYLSKNFGDPIPTATVTSQGAPEYLEDGSGRGKTWPAVWHSDIANMALDVGRTNWSKLNEIHLKVVQHWRGVIRTAVVDYRGAEIALPPFDQYDYFYEEDVGGQEVTTSLEDLATQRIDLLVVYSHPIDSSGTTLSEYTGVSPIAQNPMPPGTPRKTLEPRLGFIRGAGIGIKRTQSDKIELLDKYVQPGSQKILANLNDHLDGGSNTGIKLRNGSIVHGSFPSPDDLANIAPNLALSLEDDDLQLIGQTVLPIAYVVITKGATNLSQEDIIDIRPFLRTTELAYNERAGVAGAEPPLSFANPAVGAAQLDGVAKCLQTQIDAMGSNLTPGVISPNIPAVPAISRVYQDYIMGGLVYGVEGAILTMNNATDGPFGQTLNNVTPASLGNYRTIGQTNQRQYTRGLYEGQVALGGALTLSEWMADVTTGNGERGSYLGIPSDRVVPLLPEWQAQITPETTTPDANEWFSGGVTSEDFVWKSGVDGNISKGHYYGPLYARDGHDSNLGINTDPDLHTWWYMKRLRIILPPGARNFSVLANFANCWSGGSGGTGQPIVSRTGTYADATNGNQLVDVNIIVPCPAGPSFSDGGFPGAIRPAFYCLAADGNGSQGNRYGLGAPLPLGHGAVGGLRFRGRNAIPHPKLGYAIYPTVGFTIMFHDTAPAVGQLVPDTALTSLVTGDTGGLQWTQNPVYPPVYDRKIIDLTS